MLPFDAQPPSERIPHELRSLLCAQCGKCCQSAAFWIGPASEPGAEDHIRWIRLHGLSVDFTTVYGALYYGVSFPSACKELGHTESEGYFCKIYAERPHLCRAYDCTLREPTLFQIQDSAWNVWLSTHPDNQDPA